MSLPTTAPEASRTPAPVVRRRLPTLGIVVMLVASRISTRYVPGFWELPTPCSVADNPCTAAQAAAGLLRARLLWGVGLLLTAFPLLPLAWHGAGRRNPVTVGPGRADLGAPGVLLLAALLVPITYAGVLAAIWNGSLTCWAAFAVAGLALCRQGLAYADAGGRRLRLAVLAGLLLTIAASYGWSELRSLDRAPGHIWDKTTVNLWFAAQFVVPVAGAAVVVALAHRRLPRSRPLASSAKLCTKS